MPKLLLVEDDISLRDIYSARFEAEGYKVAVASNGEEALAAAVKEKPDLILLDVMMPRISGFDVLDIIRSTPETANTKVIMLTALSDPESKAKGEKLGVNKFLVKSQVTLEDIVAEAKKELSAAGADGNKSAEPILGKPKEAEAPAAPAEPSTPEPPAEAPSAPESSDSPPPAAG